MHGSYVVGAGATGIAAGLSTGWPVFEASERMGGLCATYEFDGFRFEPGGGHWLFGLGGRALALLERHAELRWHERRASVRFPGGTTVPYPAQSHPDQVPDAPPATDDCDRGTLKAWLLDRFGPRLCGAFFWPFNEAYTCGLYDRVQPQDAQKNPQAGAGYNERYAYPVGGLGPALERAAAGLDVRLGRRATRIDLRHRELWFSDGERVRYENLACTVPLDLAARMAGLPAGDPATGVEVLNLGAEPGPEMPRDHWVYVVGEPFHRVGFYSNVDEDFAPPGKVGLYVEGCKLGAWWAVAARLEEWGWIKDVSLVDASPVNPAYTWRWVGSEWPQRTTNRLRAGGVHALGRYGRWRFQGVAESLEEGLGFRPD